ncbi:MAG: hypothetical protein JW755_00085 [Candidatus Aminicenantes bacterium]|nr:hypothetical protein [Candidatus Aminicenantes bacterium]
MKKISTIILALFLFSCLSFGKENAQNATKLIKPSNLAYKGAFRLPDGPPGSDVKTWAWGGSAATYYPAGDPKGKKDGYPGSIFGVGHAWAHQVSEISIPKPVRSKNLKDLPIAETLQGFQDILDVSNLEIPRTGLCYLPKQGSQQTDKIHFCWGYHMQDDPSHQDLTHGWCETNLTNPNIQRGWYLDGLPTHLRHMSTNDYMFEIPTVWAKKNTPGNILATGRFRDGGWSGQGPSLYAIGPWNDGNPPASGSAIANTVLMQYDDTYTGEAADHTMKNYHHSDEWSGAAWLKAGTKMAVIFVGTKGTGDCWYGNENGPCLNCENRGWWSTGFDGLIIFYDPKDLAKVASGKSPAWKPQPYATMNIDKYLYHINSTQQKHHLAAACFDSKKCILYVLEPFVEDDKPVVHVWKVKRK